MAIDEPLRTEVMNLNQQWHIRFRGHVPRMEAWMERNKIPINWDRMSNNDARRYRDWLVAELFPPEPLRTVYEILLGDSPDAQT